MKAKALTLLSGTTLVLVAVAVVATQSATGAGKAPRAPAAAVEIEIAIDTTGSMGSSIRQAQEDARKLIADVRKFAPGARFSIVQFRDRGDTPEYQLVQPLTSDPALVEAALNKLSASGGGDTPEAYNLVFRSALDPAIGWTPGARKALVVIGDAEPHGAATAGFDKCRDTSTDPNGLNTRTEIDNLRANGITLLMVLQKSTASTTVDCYKQLAGAGGGDARQSGENLIEVVQGLIKTVIVAPNFAGADIVIAIDTTGSMGSSIRQAQADAKKLVADVKKFAPKGARFAVVQFRDKGDTPEYQIVQSLTENAGLVDAAVDRLGASGGGDTPEAHNLVYRSNIEQTLGWGNRSHRILVLISDAEPHGAAAAGFDKCRDRSTDPNGLNTATEIGGLRARGTTLLMVLQKSSASTTIDCFKQLAAAAGPGSAARQSGENLIEVIEALVKAAIVPRGADRVAPVVKALPSSGSPGSSIRLRYTVSDNSGKTSDTIVVYRRGTVLAKGTTKLGPAVKGKMYSIGWKAPADVSPPLRFCVQSEDAAGNESKVSCASIRLV